MTVAGKIFISYRRSDSTKDARAVYERLRREFGEQRVFIDFEGIAPGEDFVELLERNLDGCEVLVALIGPGWADARTEQGDRRLHDAEDFVRIELRAALTRGIKVFPVLVDGAIPPRADQLPSDLQPLVRRQAIRLDYTKFEADVTQLVKAIRAESGRRERRWLPVAMGALLVVAIGAATTWWHKPDPDPPTGNVKPGQTPTQPLDTERVGPSSPIPPTVKATPNTASTLRALKEAHLLNSVGDRTLEGWLDDPDRHYLRLAEGCLKLIGQARLSAAGADLDKVNFFYSSAIGLKDGELMPADHEVDARKLAKAIVDAYNDKNGSTAGALSQVLQ
jgi:hypothetical protein